MVWFKTIKIMKHLCDVFKFLGLVSLESISIWAEILLWMELDLGTSWFGTASDSFRYVPKMWWN